MLLRFDDALKNNFSSLFSHQNFHRNPPLASEYFCSWELFRSNAWKLWILSKTQRFLTQFMNSPLTASSTDSFRMKKYETITHVGKYFPIHDNGALLCVTTEQQQIGILAVVGSFCRGGGIEWNKSCWQQLCVCDWGGCGSYLSFGANIHIFGAESSSMASWQRRLAFGSGSEKLFYQCLEYWSRHSFRGKTGCRRRQEEGRGDTSQ